jgi:tetratricopeptide (TPR) repeat protein
MDKGQDIIFLIKRLSSICDYLMSEEKYDYAEAVYEAAIKIDPQDDKLYAGYGFALLMNKKTQKGIEELEKCLNINPEQTSVLQLLGGIRISDGQIDEGIILLEKDLDIYEKKKLHMNYGLIGNLIDAYNLIGQEEKAKHLFEKYRSQYPDDENFLRLAQKIK